jgi:hypothetical protein
MVKGLFNKSDQFSDHNSERIALRVAKFNDRRKAVVGSFEAVMGAGLCIFLSSCSPPSNLPALKQEVDGLADVGMSSSLALSKLTVAGFHCDGGAVGRISCSRMRQGLLITCNERVFMVSDEKTMKISGIDIPPLACAGL